MGVSRRSGGRTNADFPAQGPISAPSALAVQSPPQHRYAQRVRGAVDFKQPRLGGGHVCVRPPRGRGEGGGAHALAR